MKIALYILGALGLAGLAYYLYFMYAAKPKAPAQTQTKSTQAQGNSGGGSGTGDDSAANTADTSSTLGGGMTAPVHVDAMSSFIHAAASLLPPSQPAAAPTVTTSLTPPVTFGIGNTSSQLHLLSNGSVPTTGTTQAGTSSPAGGTSGAGGGKSTKTIIVRKPFATA
jgi:hypothetical protein